MLCSTSTCWPSGTLRMGISSCFIRSSIPGSWIFCFPTNNTSTSKMRTVELCMIWDASYIRCWWPILASILSKRRSRSSIWFQDTHSLCIQISGQLQRSWVVSFWSTSSTAYSLIWVKLLPTQMSLRQVTKLDPYVLGVTSFTSSSSARRWCILQITRANRSNKNMMTRMTKTADPLTSIWACSTGRGHIWCTLRREMSMTTMCMRCNGLNGRC